MMAEHVAPNEVARETAEWHNNPDSQAAFRLYAEAMERAGFRFVRLDSVEG